MAATNVAEPPRPDTTWKAGSTISTALCKQRTSGCPWAPETVLNKKWVGTGGKMVVAQGRGSIRYRKSLPTPNCPESLAPKVSTDPVAGVVKEKECQTFVLYTCT